MSIADRSILACWGVNGGRAGSPFRVRVQDREMKGLVDHEPVRTGEVIRVRTTGGGGWGSPFDRDPVLVAADARDGKVSYEGARDDYGVILYGPLDAPQIDEDGTARLRAELRSLGAAAFFDRGPGYPLLSGGIPVADVDIL
jgi:N-methylhydantoinase B